MERYRLRHEMSRRQENALNVLARGNSYIQSFRVCSHRGYVLEVELTEEGLALENPDVEIKKFLMDAIGLEPEYHYDHRKAA